MIRPDGTLAYTRGELEHDLARAREILSIMEVVVRSDDASHQSSMLMRADALGKSGFNSSWIRTSVQSIGRAVYEGMGSPELASEEATP